MGRKVAIITARGGSKRIPKKNIKEFAGKPLIQYSIEGALESQLFDEVMVSTDSQEIADCALEIGASVPFLRSTKNSNDLSTTVEALLDVIECYQSQGEAFDVFCCLYPTAPFLTAEKLRSSFEHFQKRDGDFCISVSRYPYPVQRRLSLNESQVVEFACPEFLSKRSQDLESYYHDVGQFYWGKTASLLRTKNLFSEKCLAYVLPEIETQDIDDQEDWEIAEFKYRYLKNVGRI